MKSVNAKEEKMEKKSSLISTIRSWSNQSSSQISIFAALVVLAIAFSFLSPYFLTSANWKSILVYCSYTGVMAAGLSVVIMQGGIDLSQVSSMAFNIMVAALALNSGMNIGLVLLIVISTSALIGLINGCLVTYGKINPLIATLGMQMILRALAFILTDGAYISTDNDVLRFIGKGNVLGTPVLLIITAVVYIVISIVMKYTQFGRNVYVVGGNPLASYYSGINIAKVRIFSYIISGITAGIAAIMLLSMTSVALPNVGTGSDMDIIVAAVLGGISMSGGKGNVLGVLFGVLLLAVLANGMTLLSINTYMQAVLKGMILILAIYLDSARSVKNM